MGGMQSTTIGPMGQGSAKGFSQLLNQKKRPLCAMFCASGLTNTESQQKKLCKIISSKVKHLKNTPKTPHFGGFIPQPHIHQAAPGESPPAARARWARSAMRCGRPGWPQSRRAWHEPSLPHQQRRGRQLPRPHHGHNLGWSEDEIDFGGLNYEPLGWQNQDILT